MRSIVNRGAARPALCALAGAALLAVVATGCSSSQQGPTFPTNGAAASATPSASSAAARLAKPEEKDVLLRLGLDHTGAPVTLPPNDTGYDIVVACVAPADPKADITYRVSGDVHTSGRVGCGGDDHIGRNTLDTGSTESRRIEVRIQPSSSIRDAYVLVVPAV